MCHIKRVLYIKCFEEISKIDYFERIKPKIFSKILKQGKKRAVLQTTCTIYRHTKWRTYFKILNPYNAWWATNDNE